METMIQQFSRSIGLKLVVACLLVLWTALTLQFWSNNLTMLDRLSKRFDTRLAEESHLLNASLAPPLLERDYGVLQDLLDGLTSKDAITYLVVFDHNGKVMATSGWPATRPLPPVSTGRPSDSSERYDFSLPITVGNQTYGVLRGGISTSFFAEAQDALVRQNIVIGAVALSVSGALFAGIGLWLTRRLRRVTDANQAFAQGDLQTRIPVGRTGDEIDLLGSGFNTMADALERRLDEIRESQRQQRTLANRLTLATRSGGIGVWEWDIATGKLIWDARMLEYYGLDPNHTDPDFALWRAYCHPDDVARVEAKIQETLKGTAPFDTEFRIITPAGLQRDIRAAGMVERGDDGKPTAMVGVNWNVTATRENERALEAARHQAERANRAKSEFVANMSHEIRTPMNAIMGLIYLLQQTSLNALQRDYLEKTSISARSLLQILNDILDFSKVEAGRLDLEAVPFQLEDLMKTLATITAANAREKNIEVLFRIAPGTPLSLVGDPLRLQQVLLNLSSNAIKFTEQGEVVLSVAMAEASECSDNVILTFTVRDTGMGIAPDQRNHIFDPFTQADSSTTRRFGGTGLGLAICQRLAALMKGTITLESEPGHGSTFRFTAPFVRGPEEAASTAEVNSVPDGLRVLVVDDNPTARDVMAAMIAPFGWDTEIAASGQDALTAIDRSIAENTPFDLILLDWFMPDIGGRDVLSHVKTIHMSEIMPVVLVVTAFEQDRIPRKTGGEGLVRMVLTKPVTPSALLDAVTKACSSATMRSRSASRPPAPGRRPLAGQTLLLVEDNDINQLVGRRILERAGATVETASSGVEALEKLSHNPGRFGAVLMDVQMPGLDGYETTTAIRTRPELSGLPVIAMTANALPSDRERCLAAGMNDHIAKPLDIERLLTVIGLKSRRTVRADQPAPASDRELDLARALEITGDADLLRNILAGFIKTFAATEEEIRAAVAGGDMATLARIAHTLQGVTANLGVKGLSGAAASLQTAARQNDQAQAAALVPEVSDRLKRLLADADAFLRVA